MDELNRKRWLRTNAIALQSKAGSVEAAANICGVSRQAYYKWVGPLLDTKNSSKGVDVFKAVDPANVNTESLSKLVYALGLDFGQEMVRLFPKKITATHYICSDFSGEEVAA